MLIAVSACFSLNMSVGPAWADPGVAPMPAVFAPESSSSTSLHAMPLVNTDDQYTDYLLTAQSHIESDRFGEAIDILQALICKRGGEMVSTGDGRRFVSLWLTANRLIGDMPPAGLRYYCMLYDPPAGRLYEQAVVRNDTAGLRRVVREYLHTAFGAKALDTLGAIYFDRGQFLRGARTWQRIALLHPDRPDKALLMAKIATAYHLGGDAESTQEILHQIKADHAGAEVILGGKKQKIETFLAKVLALEPRKMRQRGDNDRSWSGFTGAVDGLTRMDTLGAALMLRWRRPAELTAAPPDLSTALMALTQDLMPQHGMHNKERPVAAIRNGHLYVKGGNGNRPREFACPATLYPVVANDLILCRTDQDVTAYDTLTGEKKWRSDVFPMYRDMTTLTSRIYYGLSGQTPGDRGRNTVTVAEDKAFALGGFRPQMYPRPSETTKGKLVMANEKKQSALLDDSSTLMAISLRSGKKLWEVGHGVADSDAMLSVTKFISVPAYHNSRLYVLAVQCRRYSVICLDASTGRLLWQRVVSAMPTVPAFRRNYDAHVLERGSPPAISDGRVFVATNAGVVAAFDVETHKRLWTHQYPSDVTYRSAPHAKPRPRGRKTVFTPPNPIIVTRGQVICLPADSKKVLALSIEDGALGWETDRQGQHYLAAIDEGRILLSAPGQLVLTTARRAATRQLHPLGRVENKGIMGRPAITATEAISSGPFRLYRLNLADYRVETFNLAHSGGLLGNLVSAHGKLIAANAAGLCVYSKPVKESNPRQ